MYLGQGNCKSKPTTFPGASKSPYQPSDGVRNILSIKRVQSISLGQVRGLLLVRRLCGGKFRLKFVQSSDKFSSSIQPLLLLRRRNIPEKFQSRRHDISPAGDGRYFFDGTGISITFEFGITMVFPRTLHLRLHSIAKQVSTSDLEFR